MNSEQLLPSESEWRIMEQLWDCGGPMTSMEIQREIKKTDEMSLRMVRVLTHRLIKKGLIGYTVDEKDTRVYHFYALVSREECVRAKSRGFIDSYFAGNQTSALAALIESCQLTDEQFKELEALLENSKNAGANKPPVKRGPGRKTDKGK